MRKAGQFSMWLACLLVLLLAVVDLAMSLGPHLIGTASLSSLSAALCTLAFKVAHTATHEAANVFKGFHVLPGLCGLADRSLGAVLLCCTSCYENCFGSTGSHVLMTPILSVAAAGLCLCKAACQTGPCSENLPPTQAQPHPEPVSCMSF